MKLSKGFWTEIIAQVVAVAIIIITQFVAPEYLELALALVAAIEGIAAALVVHFAAEAKIARLIEINKLRS